MTHFKATTLALRGATALLLLGVGLGAVLRVGQVWPVSLHVANATHAHSHTLYWGWAGLALFALFFERLGVTGRLAWGALGGVALVGLLTFGVFWVFGYARPGVVLSAASVVPFGVAMALTWRGLRRARGADVPFLRAAVVFVAVSYAAAMSRVVLKVMHVDEPLYAALAVHGFLASFGAFFTLGVMGLQLAAMPGARPGRAVVLAFVGVFPWGALQVVPGVEASPLGVFFRVSAVLMVVPAVAWLRLVFDAGSTVMRVTAVAWAASVFALALNAVGLFSSFAAQRHAVVLVVHLQTLGWLTTALLGIVEGRHASPRPGLVLAHQGAAGVLLLGLGVAALWPGRPGLVVAALGGGVVVALELLLVARFWSAGAQELERTSRSNQSPEAAEERMPRSNQHRATTCW